MPWNDKQYQAATKLQELYRQRTEERMAEVGPRMDDPDYQEAQEKLQKINSLMHRHEAGRRKVDDAGKVLETPKDLGPSESVSKKFKGNYNYYYEPSVAEVQQAFRDDPDLPAKSGTDPYDVHGISSPERVTPYMDPMGMPQGETVTPARTFLEDMDENTDAYKNYKKYAWEKRKAEAEAKGELLQRYQDVAFRKGQRVDFLAGGAEKLARNYAAPAAMGAANSLSLGQAEPLYDAVRDLADYETDGSLDLPTSQAINNRSRGAHFLGEMAGYSVGFNPTNIIQREIAQMAAKRLGGEALGAGGKMLTSALSGGVSNAIEGSAGAFARSLQDQGNPTFGQAAKDSLANVPMDALAGGVLGTAFEGAAQGLGHVRNSMRESQVFNDLKVLEKGGGKANVIFGADPSDSMRQKLDREQKGLPGKANALAAKDVAPEFQERLLDRADAEYSKIDAQKREYYDHPIYGAHTTSSKPMVDSLVEMVQKGRYKGALTGDLKFANTDKARLIGDTINQIADYDWVPASYAKTFAERNGGTVIDAELANKLFARPKDVKADHVVVAVGSDVNAATIEEFEEMIDAALGMHRTSTTKESPVYQGLNRAVKSMRDKFPLYVDDAGKLVDPPATPPGGGSPSSGPATTQPMGRGPGKRKVTLSQWATWANKPHPTGATAPGSIDSVDISVKPSSTMELRDSELQPQPETMPVRDSEIKLEPETDPIPLVPAEPLKSEDFITNSGVELNTQDFGHEGPKTKAKREIEEKLAIIRGPKRKDFASIQEYMDARRNWRIQQDKGTAEDARSVHRQASKMQAEEMPKTPRMAQSEEAIPNTRRSIAPPEEQTPLSLLAGNKLAMEVPEQGPSIDGEMSPATERLERPQKSDEQVVEEALAPGRGSRSDESKRMNDLLQQREAYDEAEGMVQNIESRVGKLEPTDREKSILNIIGKKLGREITKEDLVRAGLLAGGVAAMGSDDENVQRAGAVVGMLGGGSGGKDPKQLKATIRKGVEVEGLSALRHNQNTSLKELEALEKNVGGDNENLVIDRLTRFDQGRNNVNEDQALLEVARELGMEKELREIAALTVYPQIKDKAWFAGGGGAGKLIGGFAGPRLDKVLEVLTGAGRNPFYSGSGSMFSRGKDALFNNRGRELLNLSGGRPGARFGDDARRWWEENQDEERPLDKR